MQVMKFMEKDTSHVHLKVVLFFKHYLLLACYVLVLCTRIRVKAKG